MLVSHPSKRHIAEPDSSGSYEIIQQGDNPIIGFSNEEPFAEYKNVVVFGDHTVSLYKPEKPFLIATDALKILSVGGLNGHYLFYLLQRYKPASEGYKRHYTILVNSSAWISPVSEEQQKIGSFFRILDDLITLHQRELYSNNSVDWSRSKNYFSKFLLFLNQEKSAEISLTWEQRKLGDVGAVAMNRRIFKNQTSEKGEIPFYKIGTFGGVPDAFITRELFEHYRTKYPYPKLGDILISASGSIGRTVEYAGEEAYFQDSNIVWLQHDDQLVNSFLRYFYEVVKWSGLEGSTIKRLYNKNILDTKIALPSTLEQKTVGNFFHTLDDLITLHQREQLDDFLYEPRKRPHH